MSARVDNWPGLLNAYIEGVRHTPFEWGAHDCCQFGRQAAAVLRGCDPASGAGLALRRYSSARGAARELRRLGGVEALPAACGLEEVRITAAQRGDLVVTDFENRPALGVCLGQMSAFAGERGLVFFATLGCRKAWRV